MRRRLHPNSQSRRTAGNDRRVRRAVTLMESMAALALLSVVVVLVAPILDVVQQMRAEARRHQFAVLEVANLQERLAARGGPLTDADIAGIEPSAAALRELSDPELTLTIEDVAGDPIAARRLTVSLSWENSSGERSAPVRAFRYLYVAEDIR